MDSSVSLEDEIWFLRVCHHISNAGYNVAFRVLPLDLASMIRIRHLPEHYPLDPEDEVTTLGRNVGDYLAFDMVCML
jgi:hypothetical protein